MGHKGAGLRAAIGVLQNGRLYLFKPLLIEKAPNAVEDARADPESFKRRGLRDEIEPPLSVADSLVGKAAVFVGKGEERFAKKSDPFGKDGQFAPLGFEKVSFDADDISEIELFFNEFDSAQLLCRMKTLYMSQIAVEHHLDAARLVLDMGEGIFPHRAEKNQAPRDEDMFCLSLRSVVVLGTLFSFEFQKEFGGLLGMDVFMGVGVYPELSDLGELADAVLEFLVGVVVGKGKR